MAFNPKDWEEQKEESNSAVTWFIVFIIILIYNLIF